MSASSHANKDVHPTPAKVTRKQARIPSSRKEKQDVSIMNTNNSCIVSKRSVEKIYHGRDHGFLRYFVRKFQRRSPLINRGYWLRMHAIDAAVRNFIYKPSSKRKAVVNLGCGYDTIPFNLLADNSVNTDNVVFIDVDYRKLILEKCKVIRATNELHSIIAPITEAQHPTSIELSSRSYIAVACDLENLEHLKTFRKVTNLDDYDVLFVAEVSMTYMDPVAADAVIKWAASLPQSSFCLLEQYLPAGADHPFASTMLQHFRKLHSPIKPPVTYPSLDLQAARFDSNHWNAVDAQSLWSYWQNLPSSLRQALDKVEPFDEWEEFALFASHYFIIVATHSTDYSPANLPNPSPGTQTHLSNGSTTNFHDTAVRPARDESLLRPEYKEFGRNRGNRRHAAAFRSKDKIIIHQGGHGTQGRLSGYDLLTENDFNQSRYLNQLSQTIPSERMCHTITELCTGELLMVGGRTSPDRALTSCYFYRDQSWHRVEDLPEGRFRHCAISSRNGVLVMGGKFDSVRFASDWLYWEPGKGWHTVELGTSPEDMEAQVKIRTSACAVSREISALENNASLSHANGILVGGLGADGTLLDDAWQISDVQEDNGKFHVSCLRLALSSSILENLTPLEWSKTASRFGAQLLARAENVLLVGGITKSGLPAQDCEVLELDLNLTGTDQTPRVRKVIDWSTGVLSSSRPILVGHQALSLRLDGRNKEDDHKMLVFGGGAVCFSFGTCWNQGSWLVSFSSQPTENLWHIAESVPVHRPGKRSEDVKENSTRKATEQTHCNGQPAAEVPRIVLGATTGYTDFSQVIDAREPVILTKLDMGDCIQKWTNEYLMTKVGEDKLVTVHSAQSNTMDFLSKDFTYVRKPFGDFLSAIANNAPEYLRSLSTTSPTTTPTTLEADFPSLAPDFHIPPPLHRVATTLHSSPLRIAGPVAMWLHYDVLANILCQVRGRKHLVLFPPSDARHLNFPPGASSSSLDAFSNTSSGPLAAAHPHNAHLDPGDILFIPPLWSHAARPTDGISVAVNVFFRDLDVGYAPGKDVYGNRDLAAYENARRDVARIVRGFEGLPGQAREFYLARLAAELEDAAAPVGGHHR